eukprot:scaffold32856_cov74-Phaeocystis_antarctica.AAC.6
MIIRRRPRERDFDDARLSVSRFTRIAIGSLGPRGIALPKDGRWLAMTDARKPQHALPKQDSTAYSFTSLGHRHWAIPSLLPLSQSAELNEFVAFVRAPSSGLRPVAQRLRAARIATWMRVDSWWGRSCYGAGAARNARFLAKVHSNPDGAPTLMLARVPDASGGAGSTSWPRHHQQCEDRCNRTAYSRCAPA